MIRVKKLVYGVGINDATMPMRSIVNGKVIIDPYYSRWSGALSRCYSNGYFLKKPSYKDCTVCDEWLTFSNFKSWMQKQDWKDKHLDKDLLIQGNKIYSPSTCLFVSCEINNLLINMNKSECALPIGVTFNKLHKVYQATCSSKGKTVRLGLYKTAKEAGKAYRNFKYKEISEIAFQQKEPLRSALLKYKIKGAR